VPGQRIEPPCPAHGNDRLISGEIEVPNQEGLIVQEDVTSTPAEGKAQNVASVTEALASVHADHMVAMVQPPNSGPLGFGFLANLAEFRTQKIIIPTCPIDIKLEIRRFSVTRSLPADCTAGADQSHDQFIAASTSIRTFDGLAPVHSGADTPVKKCGAINDY
jgi:hypothetical protein